MVRGSPPVSGEKRSHHISFSDLVMVREAGGHEKLYPHALGPSRPTPDTEFSLAVNIFPYSSAHVRTLLHTAVLFRVWEGRGARDLPQDEATVQVLVEGVEKGGTVLLWQ